MIVIISSFVVFASFTRRRREERERGKTNFLCLLFDLGEAWFKAAMAKPRARGQQVERRKTLLTRTLLMMMIQPLQCCGCLPSNCCFTFDRQEKDWTQNASLVIVAGKPARWRRMVLHEDNDIDFSCFFSFMFFCLELYSVSACCTRLADGVEGVPSSNSDRFSHPSLGSRSARSGTHERQSAGGRPHKQQQHSSQANHDMNQRTAGSQGGHHNGGYRSSDRTQPSSEETTTGSSSETESDSNPDR